MGSIAFLQGAALQRSYRALVLGRGLRAWPAAQIEGEAGGASVRLEQARVSAAVDVQLSARGVAAYWLVAANLAPATAYRFVVTEADRARAALDVQTLPELLPDEGVTFALASCFYNGFHDASRLHTALATTRLVTPTLAQIWVGDGIYLDVRDFDHHNANHAHEQTVGRYLEYFLDDEAYALARGLHSTFTVSDDHDFWNNYPEHQLWLTRSSGPFHAAYAQAAASCLTLFQSSLNPPAVAPGGRSFRFDLQPLSFFVADVRSARTRFDGGRGRMMLPADLVALQTWAGELTGPGVLVIGQPLWVGKGGSTDYNPPSFEAEYAAIWRALAEAPYDVLVLSGDVHHSRALRISVDGSGDRRVYEVVSSPAAHIPTLPATIGLGNARGRGKIDVPSRVENAQRSLSAEYYFGTSAPNTFGLVRFLPKPDEEVGVGVAFVDYSGARAGFAQSEPCKSLPRAVAALTTCNVSELFTLRRR